MCESSPSPLPSVEADLSHSATLRKARAALYGRTPIGCRDSLLRSPSIKRGAAPGRINTGHQANRAAVRVPIPYGHRSRPYPYPPEPLAYSSLDSGAPLGLPGPIIPRPFVVTGSLHPQERKDIEEAYMAGSDRSFTPAGFLSRFYTIHAANSLRNAYQAGLERQGLDLRGAAAVVATPIDLIRDLELIGFYKEGLRGGGPCLL